MKNLVPNAKITAVTFGSAVAYLVVVFGPWSPSATDAAVILAAAGIVSGYLMPDVPPWRRSK